MSQRATPSADAHANESDRPLEDFTNSHFGIVIQLDRLAELPALLAPAELARKTAKNAHTFFHAVVYSHHREEEHALFPAVCKSAQAGPELARVQAMVESLVAQHRLLESLWESIEPELKKVAKGTDHRLNTAVLTELVERYQDHARFEEREFLPLAHRILSRNPNHMEALGISLNMMHRPTYLAAHI